MNKKTYITMLSALIPVVGLAAPLSPEAALNRALKSDIQKAPGLAVSKWTMTEEISRDNAQAIYLFHGNGKFMVVSADDCAVPVLGYSDASSDINREIEAPAFRYWMNLMADRIAMASKAEAYVPVLNAKRPDREPIAPMVKTQWNQDKPFFNMCPVSDAQRTYTGCVATAMAQVMKYHNWPDRGEGSVAYRWSGMPLNADFSESEYQWDMMLDNYNGDYTREEGLAVALLMRDAGYAVNMNYGLSGSGASSFSIAPALGEYFKYDKGRLAFRNRDFYGLLEWEDMIYNSLKEDGPVIYDGSSYQGGHSYVCDGYDSDGYFHINWGWGGVSDGYFLFDALDPYTQGIGGSASGTGFNFNQDVILGIRPATADSSQILKGTLIGNGNFTITGAESVKFSGGEEIKITFGSNGMIYNPGPGSLQPTDEIGISFRPLSGGEAIVKGFAIEEEVPVFYGFSAIGLDLPEVADGEYHVMLVWRPTGEEWRNISIPLYDGQGYLAKVEGGEISFFENEPVELEAGEMEFPKELPLSEAANKEREWTARVTATNPSDGPLYSILLGLVVGDKGSILQGNEIIMDFEAGETKEIDYRSLMRGYYNMLTPGDYEFYLCQETSEGILGFAVAPFTVTDDSGIRDLTSDGADTATPEYYDLSGLRLSGLSDSLSAPSLSNRLGAPSGRILIRRQGSKSTKLFTK